jgi:hypothetical protein
LSEKEKQKSWEEHVLAQRGKINYSLGRTKNITPTSTLYKQEGRFSITKTNIQNALNNNDIATLRKMSNYFWLVSGEYRRLVSYYAGILTNQILAIPKITQEEENSEHFAQAYESILDYIDSASVEETCAQIELYVAKDGAYFGIERELNGHYILQTLPPAYCRSRFMIMGMYGLEFDFSFFDDFRTDKAKEEIFAAFPREFKEMYNSYLSNRTDNRWQVIDPSIARVHTFEDGAPLLASVFLDIIDLEEYKAIDKIKSRLGISKLLIHQLPIDDDGLPTLLQEEAEDLHKNVYSMITNPGQSIDVISTPAKITAIDLMDKNQKELNDIEKATNMLYTTAGTPMVLFNSGSKSSSVGLNMSIKVDEAIMLLLLKQFEKWYTNRFSKISSQYEFKAKFLEITRFNRKEMFEFFEKASTVGYPTKLATMATLGIGQRETMNLIWLENEFLKLPDNMIPPKSSHTQSGGGEAGRPEQDDLTDEGQVTRDQDKNDNREG